MNTALSAAFMQEPCGFPKEERADARDAKRSQSKSGLESATRRVSR